MDARDTKDRLVAAMADALQRRGLHGVGLTELLALAGAPKGVLYHHFPGGKTELAVAAIGAVAQRMLAALDKALAATTDPADALRAWLQRAQRQLGASGFERGCPLATVALESTHDDTALRVALGQAFEMIRERIAAAFVAAGHAPARARDLAVLVVATYEGALLQSRVAGSVEPMARAFDALLALLPAAPRKPRLPRRGTP